MMPRFFFLPLLSLFTCTLLVNGQTQTGFISIDCGIADDSLYQDDYTGINYVSDSKFIDTGVNFNLPSDSLPINFGRAYKNVRSFPNGTRNCYTLRPVTKSNKYSIKAYFVYGNYDGKNHSPHFDLYIGVTLWKTNVNASLIYQEIITVASGNYISVCLVNTGFGVPFISALELRPLKSSMYNAANESQSLVLYNRWDLGSDVETRYPTDPYDFIWKPLKYAIWVPFSTTSQVTNKYAGFEPPSTVMMSAVRPVDDSDTLFFNWIDDSSTLQFHVYKHFAELEPLKANMTREFNVCCGGSCYGHFRPEYLITSTLSTIQPLSGKDRYTCSFSKTKNSTLPPILNAIETYTILQLLSAATNNQDANAIGEIKDAYHVKKDWMGDPCLPKKYTWEGLTCSYVDPKAPRITSLNLSSSGLNGEISYSLANFTLIQSIDLSGNNLTGTVPEFLGRLPSLKLLNLTGNNLSKTLPPLLLRRIKNGSLTLSMDGIPNLCLSDSCSSNSNKKKVVVAILVPIAFAMILLIALTMLWIWQRRKKGKFYADLIVKRRKKKGYLDSENKQFTYSEVLRMTNNFQRPIGKGGFGTVYHGQLEDGTQVAVKMLSLQLVKSFTHSDQGSNEFQNEAHLLMRVHHKNLVPFVGYCDDENNMALIFTYMPEGNLGKHLSECSNEKMLCWNNRLQIALDVAQGLEYLHYFCSPPIIHRDMKTANILLNENLEAKIADFGLSKSFVREDMTHMSTAVKGTHGYLDPEYCISNKLTEKSDVYGFGVVLLQLITGQPAIIRSSDLDPMSIIQWVSPFVAQGDMRCLVDPRMKEDYDINVISKAIEIAISCTRPRSSERPTMNRVVAELKECLEIEDEIQRTSNLGVEDAIQRTSRQRREEEDIGSSSSLYPLPR